MGNKRITENDFWVCTNGAVPAQLQGSNKTTKKASGEKYITVNDKATSSWIDFGCTKLMLIYALLAAAVVVIAALTVATGGAALIALGALAGLAGAAWGAVVGTMLCGHLGAKIREWEEVPKANKTVIQGVTQVTGDYKMTCKIPGGIVTFNPKIKSWNQAIALGASNYLGKLMEGMMAGAAVGMAGALWAGGASAFASGGIRGIGQAAWQFAKSCPMNIVKNIAASFGYAGAGASTTAVWTTVGTAAGLRTATATQAGLGHYGNTGESGWGAAGTGIFAMETGMYESGQNMAGTALGWKKEDGTGYSTSWQDVAGMALLLSPVHKAPDELTSKTEPKSKVEETAKDGETKKTDEEQTVKDTNIAESESGGPAGEKETFEMADTVPKTRSQKIIESQAAYDRAQKAYDNLPNSKAEKTVASDGSKTVSGWSEGRVSNKFKKSEGVADVSPEKVLDYGKNDLGHEFDVNSSIDNGVEGQASASHAEKQMMTDNPKDAIGVSRKMCTNCKSMAQKHAVKIGEDYVVTDPEGTYIFKPDGSKPIFIKR